MHAKVLWLTALIVSAVGWPTAVDAQRNCTKGIPCGNSCISRDKVCRIGTSAREPVTSRPAPVPEDSTTRNFASPTQPAEITPASTASEYPWVGSFADGIYFKATCPPAQDLAPVNRRYFRRVADAENAGFRRSRTPGC